MKGKILLLAIPLLFSCDKVTNKEPTHVIPHHSYEEIADKVIMWNDVFLASEDDYCVYFYSRTCHYCEEIRDEVIEVALTHQMPIYFCNDNAIKTDPYLDPKSTIGMGDISKFKIKGTPSIIEVSEHVIKGHYAGKKASIDFVRNIP